MYVNSILNAWFYMLFRTCGVNIFIDYCPAAAIQRKVKWEERDIELITRMVSAAV